MCKGAEILFATSAGAKVIGTLQEGKQQKQFYDYQASQNEADAQAVGELAQVNADKIRKAGRFAQSEARTAFAGSGVAVDQGTAETVQRSINQYSEQDALNEILSGGRTARRLQSEAAMNRQAGKNALSQSRFKAAGSVLESGSTFSKWKT